MPIAAARHCQICGRGLPAAARKDARFCSGACRQASYKRRQPEVVKPTEVEVLHDRIAALKPYERRALVLGLREQLAEPDTGSPSFDMLDLADRQHWSKDGDTYTGAIGGVTITKMGRRYRLNPTGDIYPTLWQAERAGSLWSQGWAGPIPTTQADIDGIYRLYR